MASFAKVENGIVVEVLSVHNSEEHRGQEFLAEDLGLGGTWIQTSYNTFGNTHLLGGIPLRGNYAGIGFTYDAERDVFIAPKPFTSWELNSETYLWNSPIPYPADGRSYQWDESTTSWIEIPEPSIE